MFASKPLVAEHRYATKRQLYSFRKLLRKGLTFVSAARHGRTSGVDSLSPSDGVYANTTLSMCAATLSLELGMTFIDVHPLHGPMLYI